jgi:hypothetical protein
MGLHECRGANARIAQTYSPRRASASAWCNCANGDVGSGVISKDL